MRIKIIIIHLVKQTNKKPVEYLLFARHCYKCMGYADAPEISVITTNIYFSLILHVYCG